MGFFPPVSRSSTRPQKAPDKNASQKEENLFFFPFTLDKVPLPIASLCYLTDSAFLLPRRCSSASPVGPCQAPAPPQNVPAFAAAPSLCPCAPTPDRCSHPVNVNRRRAKSGCQSQFSVCLSPSLPRSSSSPACRLFLAPQA